jgi:hypothetical protein
MSLTAICGASDGLVVLAWVMRAQDRFRLPLVSARRAAPAATAAQFARS